MRAAAYLSSLRLSVPSPRRGRITSPTVAPSPLLEARVMTRHYEKLSTTIDAVLVAAIVALTALAIALEAQTLPIR